MILSIEKYSLIVLCVLSIITGFLMIKFLNKKPSKVGESYDPNLVSKIRSIGLIIIGVFLLLIIYFKR